MNLPTRRDHEAMHDPAACCMWCSDKLPWWAEVRRRAGYDAPPHEPEQSKARDLQALGRKLTKEGLRHGKLLVSMKELKAKYGAVKG